MRRSLLGMLLPSIAILFGGCAVLPSALPSDPELTEVFRLVNRTRETGADCGGESFPPAAPLAGHPLLSRAAQKHSEDMRAGGTMSHVTPEGAIHYPPGTTFDVRIDTERYDWASAGENVAWGHPDAAAVVSGWMNSPGHCRNIMNEGYRDIGLGRDGSYWTQVFGRVRGE